MATQPLARMPKEKKKKKKTENFLTLFFFSSSSFLAGPAEYVWTEIDVGSGKIVSQTSTLINKHLPLAMPVYVY
jgi:hypothetical protein